MMKTKKRTPSNTKHISAILLGQDGVGKSVGKPHQDSHVSESINFEDIDIAFTVRLLTHRYIGEYSKSEENYSHILDVDGENISMSIFDTSGTKSEKELEDLLLLGDLYIIMYSVTDRTSFGECRRLGTFLRENSAGNIDLVLVGNKTDLEHSRDILECEGSLLSEELDCRFYEISVAHNFTAAEYVVSDAVRRYLNQRNSDRPNNKTSLLKVKENFSRNKPFRSLKRRMSIS